MLFRKIIKKKCKHKTSKLQYYERHGYINSSECKLGVVKVSGAQNSLAFGKFQTQTIDIVVVNFFCENSSNSPYIAISVYTFVSVKLSRRSLHNAKSVLYETFIQNKWSNFLKVTHAKKSRAVLLDYFFERSENPCVD